MGLMKNILQHQVDDRRSTAGYHFVVAAPEVTLKRSGPFMGSSGAHLMKKTVNLDKFNNEVRAWGKKVSAELKKETSSRFSNGKKENRVYRSGIHSGKTEGKLKRSIRVKFRKESGGEQIETIAFGLERHGVFLQKGVGRGYVASGGSVARIAKSESGKYRFKQNWFNSTLEQNIKSLSNIIVHHTGDAIVFNTKHMFIQ